MMMVDVAYCWSDAKRALPVLKRIDHYDPFFLETPLNIDDLDGYRFLHEHSPIRIAAGEWQNTHWEFLDLADRGKLDVLQPDVGRVWRVVLRSSKRVCQIAEDRGRLIVPHCWKSAIGIAASAHLCAATAVCPFIEFLPAELSESVLRGELVAEELSMEDGKIRVAAEGGTSGIELNMNAVRRFSDGGHAPVPTSKKKLVAAR